MNFKAIILLLLLTFPIYANGQVRYYSYFKEKIPLVPKSGLISSNSFDPALSKSLKIRSLGVGWQIVDGNSISAVAKNCLNEDFYYSNVFNSPNGGELIVTQQVMVCFEKGVPFPIQKDILNKAGLTIVKSDYKIVENLFLCKTSLSDSDAVLDLSNSLAARKEIVFCEPDFLFSGQSDILPTDTYFDKCWGLHNIGQNVGGIAGLVDIDMDLPQAWEITTGSSDIIVVVIDTGITLDHPDLTVSHAKDFVRNPAYKSYDGGPANLNLDFHGTLVAGCVAAKINGIGTVGGAPGCALASARAMHGVDESTGEDWFGLESWTVNALEWAVDIGARITVNSNAYGLFSSTLDMAYAGSREAGIVHFASSGNNRSSNVAYPANLPSVNAVAGVNSDGSKYYWGNYGPEIAFSAPAKTIYTTDNLGTYGFSSGQIASAPEYAIVEGTSLSAPYAASVAALILSVDSSLTPDEVELIMANSAVDLGDTGRDDYFGYGMPNAFWAVTMAYYSSCKPADINRDKIVNMADMSILAGNYLSDSDNCQLSDLNCSGKIDLADIDLFLKSWLVKD